MQNKQNSEEMQLSFHVHLGACFWNYSGQLRWWWCRVFSFFFFFKKRKRKRINFPASCTCQPNWLKLQPKIAAWTALVFSPTLDIDLVCPTSIQASPSMYLFIYLNFWELPKLFFYAHKFFNSYASFSIQKRYYFLH